MYEIHLTIQNEKELYNPFDETCRTLSSNVSDYLAGQYGRKETGDEIVLKIKCCEPVNFERVCAAFQELIREQELHNANQKKLNRIKQLWLFGVGVVFVAAGILLDGVLGSVPVELISIVGSFAVWEAANIWIVENPRTRLARRMLKKLNATKIIIEQPQEGHVQADSELHKEEQNG